MNVKKIKCPICKASLQRDDLLRSWVSSNHQDYYWHICHSCKNRFLSSFEELSTMYIQNLDKNDWDSDGEN